MDNPKKIIEEKYSLYKIFGLEANSEISEIEKAYSRLTLQYHPDGNQSEEEAEKFRKVEAAIKIFRFPQAKDAYDRDGILSLHKFYHIGYSDAALPSKVQFKIIVNNLKWEMQEIKRKENILAQGAKRAIKEEERQKKLAEMKRKEDSWNETELKRRRMDEAGEASGTTRSTSSASDISSESNYSGTIKVPEEQFIVFYFCKLCKSKITDKNMHLLVCN